MSYLTTLSAIFLAVLSTGCMGGYDIYSSSEIHRTVRLSEPGVYVVDYRWREVEEQFGKDRTKAVPAYLKAKGIVPPECAHGVVVIRGGEVEGGGGWAEFRCE